MGVPVHLFFVVCYCFLFWIGCVSSNSAIMKSVIKIDQFVLYGAEVAVCSEMNKDQINTVWAERTVVEC